MNKHKILMDEKNNIEILDFHFALELISENNSCYGAYVLNEKTNGKC